MAEIVNPVQLVPQDERRISLQLTRQQWSWVVASLLESETVSWRGLGHMLQLLLEDEMAE